MLNQDLGADEVMTRLLEAITITLIWNDCCRIKGPGVPGLLGEASWNQLATR